MPFVSALGQPITRRAATVMLSCLQRPVGVAAVLDAQHDDFAGGLPGCGKEPGRCPGAPTTPRYRDLGDRAGQANALNDLGVVRRATGEYPAAAQAHAPTTPRYRDLGDRLGQAAALSCLGVVRRLTGEYPGAAQAPDPLTELNALTGAPSAQ